MRREKKLFSVILTVSLFLFSCRQSSSPSSGPPPIYLYLTVQQNSPACPLTLTLAGPATFQDVLGTGSLTDSLIAFNLVSGNYSFYFNGATDGVLHSLTQSATITCMPALTTSCANWSYTFAP